MAEIGSMGEEAAKLLAAIQDWAAQAGERGVRVGDREHLATGAPECAHCPVCQLICVLRGDRPELTERLVEAGTAVVVAVRALLEQTPQTPEREPRVQKIDLNGTD